MKINDLFSKNGSIYRILSMEFERIQIIDCIKRTMPHWVSEDFIADINQVDEDELRKTACVVLASYDNLTQQERQIIHTNMVASVLSFPL